MGWHHWGGKTDLIILNRSTLTGHQYIDEILDTQVGFYAGAVGEKPVLMDEKVQPHSAYVVQDYLQRECFVH